MDRRLAAADMQLASTRVYYALDPVGSDRNPGTKARPWKSIYAAINKMTHGGHLYVRGGSYSYSGENIIGARRTGSTRVVISNYPGERVIFRTSSTQADLHVVPECSRTSRSSGLTVYGRPEPRPPWSVDGGAIFQFTGNMLKYLPLQQPGVRRAAVGGHAARRLHRRRDRCGVTIKSNLFDGRGGDEAGFHAYHDPNGLNVIVTGNVFRNWDQLRPGVVEHPLARDHPEQPAELPDRHPLSRVQMAPWSP